MIALRPAMPGDAEAIEALLAPAVSRGAILPRVVASADFIVARQGTRLVGCVALTHQSSRVIELGSLVSTLSGVGLGRRLVEAATQRAATRGYDLIMALTAIPEFFQRTGFEAASHAPWITAREQLRLPHPLPLAPAPEAVAASRAKATTCRVCPRLGACAQTLVLRAVPAARHQRRA